VITATESARFDVAAQAVRPALIARLRAAGAAREDAEDAAQEALLRAWSRRVSYADDGDLLRWCTVVARHAHIDRVRHERRLRALPEIEAAGDTAELESVELRHLLRTVRAALPRLTEAERRSLTDVSATDRAGQVRRAVARHRARSRLRLLVGPFAAAVAAAGRMLRRSVPVAGAVAAIATVFVVGQATLSQGAKPPPAPVLQAPAAAVARAALPVPGLHRRTVVARSPLSGQRATVAHHPPHRAAPVAAVHGPAGLHTSVSERPRGAGDHVFCLSETGLDDVCVL
jgi:hypothetical protein